MTANSFPKQLHQLILEPAGLSAGCSTLSLMRGTVGFYILSILMGCALVFDCGLNLYLDVKKIKQDITCLSLVPLILASRKKETHGPWQSRKKENDNQILTLQYLLNGVICLSL